MKLSRLFACTALTLTILVNVVPLAAQELRDPTVSPAESSSANTSAGRSVTGVEGVSVVVRDGTPFLVVGTRLYAPGDRFGTMRVQRISETEVILHDGNGLVKMPRFAGIERKTVVEKTNCSAPKPASATKPVRATAAAKTAQHPTRAASQARLRATKPPVAVAPCEDTPS